MEVGEAGTEAGMEDGLAQERWPEHSSEALIAGSACYYGNPYYYDDLLLSGHYPRPYYPACITMGYTAALLARAHTDLTTDAITGRIIGHGVGLSVTSTVAA